MARRRRGTARVSFEESWTSREDAGYGPTTAPPRADLTKTVELVQGSWKKIVDAGVTYEAAGGILFKHIFRIAPQALPLFSFGRVDSEGAEVNDALFAQEDLKAHATKVVATVATCARKSNFRRPRGPRHRQARHSGRDGLSLIHI